MNPHTALGILKRLADGTDPHTGESFPADSPYQHPDTVRALFLALRALESTASKVGQPWSKQEDEKLAAAFDAGTDIPALVAAHQRSRAGIEARLAKLGKITLPEGALRYKPRTPPAATGNTPVAQSPSALYEVCH